jgi:hypothetical protein
MDCLEAKKMLQDLNKVSFNFHLPLKRASFYRMIFCATKNTKGLRGLVYKIREHSSLFTKRRPFRFNESISAQTEQELKTRLKNNPLFINELKWIEEQS